MPKIPPSPCAWSPQAKTNKVKDDDLLLEHEVEQQPSAEQAQQKAVEGMHHLTESHGPAADLPSRPILGVHEDLSGAALVRKAIEGGQGQGMTGQSSSTGTARLSRIHSCCMPPCSKPNSSMRSAWDQRALSMLTY